MHYAQALSCWHPIRVFGAAQFAPSICQVRY